MVLEGVAGTVLELRCGKQSNAFPGLAWSHKLLARTGTTRNCPPYDQATLELFPQEMRPTPSSTCQGG